MITLLEVGLGGLIGAPARYVVDQYVTWRTEGAFPWGTFVINAGGALLLGLIAGLVSYHHLGPVPVAIVGTGFCGAYTTFSTFTFETIRLIEEGEMKPAIANVAGSVAVGLLAAAAGIAVAALV